MLSATIGDRYPLQPVGALERLATLRPESTRGPRPHRPTVIASPSLVASTGGPRERGLPSLCRRQMDGLAHPSRVRQSSRSNRTGSGTDGWAAGEYEG